MYIYCCTIFFSIILNNRVRLYCIVQQIFKTSNKIMIHLMMRKQFSTEFSNSVNLQASGRDFDLQNDGGSSSFASSNFDNLREKDILIFPPSTR